MELFKWRLSFVWVILLVSFVQVKIALAQNQNGNVLPILKYRVDLWCPFHCEPNSKNEGFYVDLVRSIFGKNYNIVYESVSFERGVKAVESGDSDVGSFAGVDSETALFPAKPTRVLSWCFFVRQDSTFAFKNVKDLENQKLLLFKEYVHPEPVGTYVQENLKVPGRIVQVAPEKNSVDQEIRLLASKRVDVILEEKSVIAYKKKSDPKTPQIKEVGCLPPTDLKTVGWNLVFSPKSKLEGAKLLKTYEEGIKQLRQSGELAKLESKYGLETQ
jgi:polar amino acid transport system substrate-binding protein